VKVLVTGADGFVGGWLVRALLGAGHTVGGTRGPDGGPSRVLTPDQQARIDWRPLDLRAPESVRAAVQGSWDAVVHLAAVASGGEARRDPGLAWNVNAAGTARLAEALLEANPLLLLVSTGEVYGQGSGVPRREADPVAPCSPYAASKAGAELAAQEAARRAGFRVVVARPFPHTGPGQDGRFVLPALAARLKLAHRIGAPAINTGNLEPVRDLLDVRDVATAYLALLSDGRDGETYNIASGQGHRLADLLSRMQRLLGSRVLAEYDPALARRSDILHLVGDASRLRAATGWMPRIPLDQTLQDLLDAQTD
jgi:GDP-4-dehydro-6-deoxy-D-mannose reductase